MESDFYCTHRPFLGEDLPLAGAVPARCASGRVANA